LGVAATAKLAGEKTLERFEGKVSIDSQKI